MNSEQQKRLEQLVKESLLPMSDQAGAELERDLWPRMLQHLSERSAKVPWFDWALLATVAVWLVLFPRVIPVLLYHL